MEECMSLEDFLGKVVPSLSDEYKGITPDYVRNWEDEENRVIRTYGYINDENGAGVDTIDILEQLVKYQMRDKGIPVEQRKPIVMYIDSFGGDAQGTMVLSFAMRMSKTPINTVNNGHADSAGGILFMSGDRRFARLGSEALVHTGSFSVSGNRE